MDDSPFEFTGAGSDDAFDEAKPWLSFMTVTGIVLLAMAAGAYGAYGLASFPEPYWLIEGLAAILFVAPIYNVFRGRGTLRTAVRIIGAALIVHAGWDALHWPEFALIQTPVDPWLPRWCPAVDLPVGLWLVLFGK
jgi:hypothetical protein